MVTYSPVTSAETFKQNLWDCDNVTINPTKQIIQPEAGSLAALFPSENTHTCLKILGVFIAYISCFCPGTVCTHSTPETRG